MQKNEPTQTETEVKYRLPFKPGEPLIYRGIHNVTVSSCRYDSVTVEIQGKYEKTYLDVDLFQGNLSRSMVD